MTYGSKSSVKTLSWITAAFVAAAVFSTGDAVAQGTCTFTFHNKRVGSVYRTTLDRHDPVYGNIGAISPTMNFKYGDTTSVDWKPGQTLNVQFVKADGNYEISINFDDDLNPNCNLDSAHQLPPVCKNVPSKGHITIVGDNGNCYGK